MKKCNKCGLEKELELFKKDKRRNDGCASSCKLCISKEGLEYYHRTKLTRKENLNKNRKKSYYKNKESEKLKSKLYKLENSDKIKKYNKNYYEDNIDLFSKLNKEYRNKNKEYLKEYQKNYINERLKNDVLFRASHYYRNMIRKSFKKIGYKKSSKSQEILGCSFEEFKLYLESKFEDWMTWDNHGLYNGEFNYGWDIDHIIPLSSAKTEEDVIRLNHFTNLQPLCSKINRDIKKDSNCF